MRSSEGCWTCKLRRKKCDENRPTCDGCTVLYITCHYDEDKPEWMDGGVRQEEMGERLKREVKENAHRRRRMCAADASDDRVPAAKTTIEPPQRLPNGLTTPPCNGFQVPSNIQSDGVEPCPRASPPKTQHGADCTLIGRNPRDTMTLRRSDTVLLTFYLEQLLPFLFPFYKPSLFEGGRSWILEMMISSPVVRQATLCQSSYFFSIALGAAYHDVAWDTVLMQTGDAFEVLRKSLQVIEGSNITEHMHGAVRIMASIMQVQRFEIAVLSFKNCLAHLNAAQALFSQLLDSEPAEPSSSFNAVMNRLGPPSRIAQGIQVPSAEQVALRFSSSLLMLDDIVASTILQEQPRLYRYHSLLKNVDGIDPLLNLEAIVGCQNRVLVQIGEISALDAWKQQCKKTGTLDVMELVRLATIIKGSLEAHLTQLETNSEIISSKCRSLLDVFTAEDQQSKAYTTNLSSSVTRVWAHAALIYLSIVVSGWQPASVDVRYHVNRALELLERQISPPALLRTMVWPFCVVGCFAESAQKARLRQMVEVLQPPSAFGTVRKALEIMENVWRDEDSRDAAKRDLATCFRSYGDLVLLV